MLEIDLTKGEGQYDSGQKKKELGISALLCRLLEVKKTLQFLYIRGLQKVGTIEMQFVLQ